MMSWLKSFLSLLAGRRTPSYRLGEALAGLPEAVALFDANDRLLYCNAAFRRTYHIPSKARARGRTFPAILYTSRLFDIAEEPLRDPRTDEMCDRILAHYCAANGQTLVLPMVDGRRVELRALRTEDGGTLSTRLEIAGPGHQNDERVVDFQSVYLARKV
jgi:two-component system cell cycle sensor histidine kinase PleC